MVRCLITSTDALLVGQAGLAWLHLYGHIFILFSFLIFQSKES